MNRIRGYLLIILGLLLAGSLMMVLFIPGEEPSLLGYWRSQDAANLLFDFREDESVHLLQDGVDYQVFRYQVRPAGADLPQITLYDGMGRPMIYRFFVTPAEMVFYDPKGPVVRTFRRED